MIKIIDEKIYEQFNQQNAYYNFFQNSKLACARKYLYSQVLILGCYQEEELVATTLLLLEKLPKVNYYIANVIMGVNIDYTNQELLKFYAKQMKQFMKKQNVIYTRFDFDVYKNQCKQDYSEAEFDLDLIHIDGFDSKLVSSGFKQIVSSYDYFGKSPQWSMITDTSTSEIISKQLNRSVKRGIKDSKKYGCEAVCIKDVFAKDELYDKTYLEIFYDLHNLTAKTSNFKPFDIQYFETMTKNCKDQVFIYLVKVDTEILKSQLTLQLEKKQNKRISDALKIVENCKLPYFYVVGHMSALFNKVGYDLFTGLNYEFGFLGAKELVYESIFETCLEYNIKYYDYWGIVGLPDEKHVMYPIYKFKSKFSQIIIQKHGFFDLYPNKFNYDALNLIMKLRKKVR